eukprot:12068409-Alexandrium_andersonii.AAC.1
MARAAPRTTVSTSACGPTLMRLWIWRLSPRGTASGIRRHAVTSWGSLPRLAAPSIGRKSSSSPSA